MRFSMAATAAVLASCASPSAPAIRLALAPFEVPRGDFRGEPVLSSREADDCLRDRLAASGRFTLLERRNFEAIFESLRQGDVKPELLAGAEWIAYGTLEGTEPWHPGAPGSKYAVDVTVKMRVVRVDDGVIIYSKSHRGSVEATWSTDDEWFLNAARLLGEANRIAVSKLADDLVKFKP